MFVAATLQELWSCISDNEPEIVISLHAPGIVTAVARSGKGINIANAYEDGRFNRMIDQAIGYLSRQIICLPLQTWQHATIGVVQCINKNRHRPLGGTGHGGAFTPEDEQRLSELCYHAATVLEPRALEASERRSASTQLVAHTRGVGSMTERVDNRSPTPVKAHHAPAAVPAAGAAHTKTLAAVRCGTGRRHVAIGDAIGRLLELVQTPPAATLQLAAASALAHVSVNEANCAHLTALGGVRTLFELATPVLWRSKVLLQALARLLGNLSRSFAVQSEAHRHGGWKSLLVLSRPSVDRALVFDALRALANLAAHAPLRAPIAHALRGEIVRTSIMHVRRSDDTDLQAQALRLLSNLSNCGAAAGTIERAMTREAIGRAALEAADADAGRGSEAVPAFAAALAMLTRRPAFACWLFSALGLAVLQRLAKYMGPLRRVVREHVAAALAQGLEVARLNQQMLLGALAPTNTTAASFHTLSTMQQRATVQRDKERLLIGREARVLLKQLLCGERSPSERMQRYCAAALAALASEPENHVLLLDKGLLVELLQLAARVNKASRSADGLISSIHAEGRVAQELCVRAIRFLASDDVEIQRELLRHGALQVSLRPLVLQ